MNCLSIARAVPRLSGFAAFLFVLIAGVSGCATQSGMGPGATSADDFQEQIANEARISDLNEQLLAMAVESGLGGGVYRVGPEDQIQIDVFGVEDLSREYRVDGHGRVTMPLIGAVAVSGLSLDEVEQRIAQKYGESYLRSPQISAQVTEFRSQQFTVVGAVASPRVYSVSRQVTLIEALAMAGGVTAEAGENVFLTDRVRNPETGLMQVRSLLVAVEDLMQYAGETNVVLGESALVNIPRGGFVYVEGEVNRPGAFAQKSAKSVLTALAQAGGLKFEADRSSLRVLRRNPTTGAWNHVEVDYAEIRDDPNQDVLLQNGDVVVVATSAMRSGWTGAWRAVTGLAILGFRPL